MKLNLNLKSKLKNLSPKKLSKKTVVISVVVVAAVALSYNTVKTKFFSTTTAVVQKTVAVKKGNLKTLVSGSGSIYFTNTSKVYSKTNGTVTKANFKEGDTVKAGDTIYELDNIDTQSSIDSNKNNLSQSLISATASNEDVAKLVIKAPISGQVTDVAVKNGDTVQKGGTVFNIIDKSKFKVSLPFNVADFSKISVGQAVNVYLPSLNKSIKGTVTYINIQAKTSSDGSQFNTVDIQMNNSGDLLSGINVSANIITASGDVSSKGTAAIDYANKKSVVSETGGVVQSISVVENQNVNLGAVLVNIKNNDIIRSKENADLKVASSQAQLDSTLKQLDKYKITSLIDGVITKINFKVGDTVKSGDEVSSVSDPSQIQFDIPIDELDVANLKIGQKTSISVDSLPVTTSTPLMGEVSKIAVQGTAVSGVTTFPVVIKFNDKIDNLKGSMNANAKVEVQNKDDVLYVPIEAVTTVSGKSYVWVKGSGTGAGASGMGGGNSRSRVSTTKSNPFSSLISSISGSSTKTTSNYYVGAVKKEVVIGINNDTSIEITSGLNEGDVIILPQTTTSTTTKSSTNSNSGGDVGGPRGGGF